MENKLIQVAAATPCLKIGDVKYNVKEITDIIKESEDCGLIVFPELSVTGYTSADLFQSNLLLKESQEALPVIAQATKGRELTVVVGVPFRYANSIYNCAAILSDGIIKALIPKSYIPDYSEFYEIRWFVSGRGIKDETVKICGYDVPFGVDVLAEDSSNGAVLGVEICEDLWVPDKPSTHATLAGANIIANLSASDELIGKQNYRTQLVKQQSGSCYCAYIYASSGTGESSTDLVFSGHSIIAQNGSLLTESIFPEYPHIEKAIIDLQAVMHDRRHQNTFENENVSGYRRVDVNMKALGCSEVSILKLGEILKQYDYTIARNPFVPEDDDLRKLRCEKILRIQANGLATRVRSTGIKNLVIGISGGLDSTLALLVCHEAKKLVKDIRIIAYTMPNRGNTTRTTFDNAGRLMKLLADESHEVPIEEGVKLHFSQLGHEDTYQGEGDVVYENAQARMRTYILMDAANMLNGLVVGTGDLSELALGWCTYNGDHMSMYAVNASIPKTLVRYICRTYANTCGNKELKDVILSVCDTPITPELTPNKEGEIAQKTEEKIGKYDLNDFFLFYTLRYGFEPSRSVAYAMKAYPEVEAEELVNVAKNFFKRFFSQQFKRSCLPDGPKVGSVSLSPRGDWRMPSDASVSLWLEDLENI
ncbi:MAG: NAD(+) synthase [Lachnospiraceae bacterium]|nr:NAD(+) synthase [Lachnospiraceae bacterium]